MTADATRYRLLTALAWHLAALRRTSLIVVPSHGEPVLYLPRQDGSKLGIAAGQRNDGAWDFLWGRTRTPRLADQLSESSRGLFLIAELAVRSGYMRTGQGGRYWFEL